MGNRKGHGVMKNNFEGNRGTKKTAMLNIMMILVLDLMGLIPHEMTGQNYFFNHRVN